ncbi:MAG: hypothetical protein ACRER2_17230, partial [Methylococcales bacterium]
AGILVTMLFALQGTRVGGPVAAYATLNTGLLVHVYAAHIAALDYPYLTSLASALAIYLLMSLVSRPAPLTQESVA